MLNRVTIHRLREISSIQAPLGYSTQMILQEAASKHSGDDNDDGWTTSRGPRVTS